MRGIRDGYCTDDMASVEHAILVPGHTNENLNMDLLLHVVELNLVVPQCPHRRAIP